MKATYYQILTVAHDANVVQIKIAYRKQCSKYHPDRNKSPHATLFTQVVNEAYACLSDPYKRRQYDKTLIISQSKPTSRPKSKPYFDGYDSDEEKNPYSEPKYSWYKDEDEEYMKRQAEDDIFWDRQYKQDQQEQQDKLDEYIKELQRHAEVAAAIKKELDEFIREQQAKRWGKSKW